MDRVRRIAVHVGADVNVSHALNTALRLADCDGAEVFVVSTIDKAPWITKAIWPHEARTILEDLIDERNQSLRNIVRLADYPRTSTHLCVGKSTPELLAFTRDYKIDLLILDRTPAPDIAVSFLDSLTTNMLRKAPCPVCVHALAALPENPAVLAAIDVQDDTDDNRTLNAKIVETAANFATNLEGHLHIVQAWESYADTAVLRRFGAEALVAYRSKYRDDVDRAVQQSLSPLRVPFQTHVINGAPADSIRLCASEHNVALIVIGTVGRTGLSGQVIGNTAERVIHDLGPECSLIAIKPGESPE